MRKIYLASDSKARKALLELFGMKFTVISSGVREKDQGRRGLVCAAGQKKRPGKGAGSGKKGA